jgi:hypothetical protein
LATRKAKQNDIDGAYVLYKNCVLEADEEVKKNDLLQLMATEKLGELIHSYKAKRVNY